jgi:hypothetical protein
MSQPGILTYFPKACSKRIISESRLTEEKKKKKRKSEKKIKKKKRKNRKIKPNKKKRIKANSETRGPWPFRVVCTL